MKSKKIWIYLIIIIATISLITIQKVKVSYSLTELKSPTSNNMKFNNNNFIRTNNNTSPFNAPDPSIIYENGTYYLYGTFSGSGIGYYTSTDLTNWKYQGLIIKKDTFNNGSQSSFDAYWAPEVFKYNNKYYMIFSAGTTSNWYIQMFIAVANSLTDEWTYYCKVPLSSYAWLNIDGTVYIENNKVYLYYHAGDDIYAVQLSSDLKSLLTSPKKVVTANQSWAYHSSSPLNEGPAILKYNNTYYLMYSANDYYTKYYAVGYATASSPLGPFTDQSKSYPILSSKNGPGHNSYFTTDGSNYYIVYHSISWASDGSYDIRKLNLDTVGIDSNGKLYINGPSTIDQPMPSGHKGINKVSFSEYTILNGSTNVPELKDNINYNAENTANYLGITPQTKSKTVTTSSITINLTSNKNIEDIWLFGNSSGFQGKTVDVTINDKYIIKSVSLGKYGTAKIQLPEISEYVKKINLKFSSSVVLSEISLYKNKEILTLNNNNLELEESIIKRIGSGETFKTLQSKLTINGSTSFKDQNNTTLTATQKIKTGDKIIVTYENKSYTYTLSILGDLTGDGEVKINDVSKLYRAVKINSKLTEAEKASADTVKDNQIKINDVSRLYRYSKGVLSSLS